jgi:hypothetical protein
VTLEPPPPHRPAADLLPLDEPEEDRPLTPAENRLTAVEADERAFVLVG